MSNYKTATITNKEEAEAFATSKLKEIPIMIYKESPKDKWRVEIAEIYEDWVPFLYTSRNLVYEDAVYHFDLEQKRSPLFETQQDAIEFAKFCIDDYFEQEEVKIWIFNE